MVPLAAGLVVLVRFPFSNLSQAKLFTASGELVKSVVGVLQPESVRKVIAAVVTILGGSR